MAKMGVALNGNLAIVVVLLVAVTAPALHEVHVVHGAEIDQPMGRVEEEVRRAPGEQVESLYPVFEYDEETKQWLEELSSSQGWQQLQITGGPSPRVYAASTNGAPVPPPYSPTDRSGIVVFGGTNNATSYEKVFGDLWVLNAQDMKSGDGRVWTQISLYSQSVAPAPRALAAIAMDPTSNNLYLFGGYDGQQWYNDLWSIDLLTIQHPGEVGTWTSIDVSNSYEPMPPLCGMALFWFPRIAPYVNAVTLFGGGDDKRQLFNNVYYYDPNQYPPEWTYVTTSHPPSAREFFSYWVESGLFYVFGGYDYGYDFFNDTHYFEGGQQAGWTVIEESPPPPSRCCAQVAFSAKSNGALLYGGRNLDVLFDMWFFDSSYKSWSEVQLNLGAPGPGPIFGAAAGHFLQGDGLIIVGGAPGLLDEPVSSIWFFPFGAVNTTWP